MKTKWKKGKFGIAVKHSMEKTPVEGETFGSFGVHREKAESGFIYYVLTHLPTGRKIGNWKDKQSVKILGEYLNETYPEFSALDLLIQSREVERFFDRLRADEILIDAHADAVSDDEVNRDEKKKIELTPIVKRAMVETVVDIGQLSVQEIGELNAAVKAGYLAKGKGGPYPAIKTVYAVPTFDFAASRGRYMDEANYLHETDKKNKFLALDSTLTGVAAKKKANMEF